jgi:hypothetical protein
MSDGKSNADRKAIKREYKESYRPAGVFQLRNTVSGRIFVSASPNLPAISNRLRMQLDAGDYVMLPELQREWKELGGDKFVFEVLEELTPPDGPGWDPTDDLAALELLWLEQLEPWGTKGYNPPPKR